MYGLANISGNEKARSNIVTCAFVEGYVANIDLVPQFLCPYPNVVDKN
jgi:hypothetical protein